MLLRDYWENRHEFQKPGIWQRAVWRVNGTLGLGKKGDPMPARWGPHGQELSREFGVQRLEKGLFISREWQDSQGLP